MKLKKGYKQLVAEAEAEIESINAAQAMELLQDDSCLLVDLRDIRELRREGGIPGAIHVPRGMLEFWIDPDCPYHRKEFASGKRFIFFCNLGWRSALAAKVAQDMGLSPVCHIAGGFEAWKECGGPVIKK
jgi:rhodanese-related sulfurtransferase